jgi:hypothetical protein
MTNPYKAPESEVGSGIPQIHSKAAWKGFFWVILVFEVLSLIASFYVPIISWFALIAEIIIYGLILTGLFGFAYNKKILYKNLWGYLIPSGIFFDVYSIFSEDFGELSNDLELYFVIGLIVVFALPLMFFQYLALYKYRFKSDSIWL